MPMNPTQAMHLSSIVLAVQDAKVILPPALTRVFIYTIVDSAMLFLSNTCSAAFMHSFAATYLRKVYGMERSNVQRSDFGCFAQPAWI